MIFVDTNYFLRFLLADIIDQHKKAKALFLSAAEGKKKIFTSTIVIFELYWVLTSFYEKNKKNVAQVLKQILNMHFVSIEERDILNMAVDVYQKSALDLEDAYNMVYAKTHEAKMFETFDRKLQKIFVKS
ncbi:MAG: PilT protein [uncultured bacterium]|uniref:PIN domain-containing protein n=1 Tax=Candidatus Gottesmanbacteria bacterium RIFCSPLOWO2_01_FULL_43_11b TaxID=1798392 RepID=A0A1F6AHD4_9BACT|nr:MAG: PilT protein [uncultured bacterium]OGG24150.1 MAG: hypothetical protein A3A79_03085 [Candidatus Gottesmanbacteria bacterium RIFCSPLOWO2_01_FULL_43_11b]